MVDSTKNSIMSILLTNDEEEIKEILTKNGFAEKNLFSVNTLENGKYDVTIGFNANGKICTKELSSHLEAYKFAAIRTILGCTIIIDYYL